MNITEIPVGSNVILDIERSGIYYTLHSKVYDLDDSGIFVYFPSHKLGQIKQLCDRDTLHFRFLNKDKVLQWKITHKETVKIKDQDFVYLKSTDKCESSNKRDAYRISLNHGTLIREITSSRMYNVEILNLSQTGIAFKCDDILANGDVFCLTITDSGIELPLRVKITRMFASGNSYAYGCTIVHSNQELRKYISNKQLEEIRKLRGL